MLFAVWAENRATEDAEQASVAPSHYSTSVHTISRQNSAIMTIPTVRLASIERDDAPTVIKIEELEAAETQTEVIFDDKRPAIFKSTFWEVCAVAALISAQLCNVYHKRTVLIAGISSRSTNCNSCLDSIFPFNHWTTGLGQCCIGNPCRLVLASFWEVGGHIWSETRALDSAADPCCWRYHLWGQLSRVALSGFKKFSNVRYVFYIGRAFQGLACAGFIPAGIGILASLYSPGRRKNRVFAAFSAGQPLGGCIGGLFSKPFE